MSDRPPAVLTKLEKKLLHALQLYTREQEFDVKIIRAQQAVAGRRKKKLAGAG